MKYKLCLNIYHNFLALELKHYARPTNFLPCSSKTRNKLFIKAHTVNPKILKKFSRPFMINFSSVTYSGLIESKSLSSAGRDDSIFPFPAIISAGLIYAQIYQNLTK
jgi:hypothetical protein